MRANVLSRRVRSASLLAGVLLSALLLPVVSTSPVGAASEAGEANGPRRGDFNGDGFADLAIGVPLEDLTAENQGAVTVIYGSPQGLDPRQRPDQLLVQTDPEGPEAQDGFGLSLAVGDFNGDGFGDLAVGANGEDKGRDGNNEGAVTVFYGSPSGLMARSAQYLTEPKTAENDQFGFTLAAGDFNGDGRDELAVSVLNRRVGGAIGAGSVVVFRGAAERLDAGRAIQVDQAGEGTKGWPGIGDQFGSVLAAGDLNGDGRDDLAAGIPNETVNGVPFAGAVSVFFGCAEGPSCALLDSHDQYLSQHTPAVAGAAERGDLFGIALAIGDFGRGGPADLAVGVLREDFAGVVDAGAVEVFYGTSSGPSTSGTQLLFAGRGGVPEKSEAGDEFGAVLAAGDVGKGGEDDLVIGTPFEDLGLLTDAGAVTVLYGGPDGLSSRGGDLITQDAPRIPGVTAAGHGFGKTVAIADFGRSDREDLAVASRDAVSGAPTAGAVTVVYGVSDSGPLSASAHMQYVTQDTAGIDDSPENNDLFGGAWGQPGLAG
jgi:hypothetical protein